MWDSNKHPRGEDGQWTIGAVAALIFNLKGAEKDNAAFDELIERLKGAKIGQPAMHQIASGYLDLSSLPKSMSKKDLIQKMVQRQVDVSYEATKSIQVGLASRFVKGS